MDWEKLIDGAIYVGKRAAERYAERKAAEATYNFIVYTIVSSIISVVLALFLPLWLVGLIFAIIGVFRFISSYGKIETGLSARRLGKTLGIWDRGSDMKVAGHLIYPAALFIVIKIIKNAITPKEPVASIGIANFFSANAAVFANILLVSGGIILPVLLIISLCKRDGKYITIGLLVLLPVLLPVTGINFFEKNINNDYIATLAKKGLFSRILFYALAALVIDLVISTVYKKNLKSTYTWKTFFAVAAISVCLLIYFDKFEYIKNLWIEYRYTIFPRANIFFIVLAVIWTIICLIATVSATVHMGFSITDILTFLFFTLLGYGVLIGCSYLSLYLGLFFLLVIAVFLGIIIGVIVSTDIKKPLKVLNICIEIVIISSVVFLCKYFNVLTVWSVFLMIGAGLLYLSRFMYVITGFKKKMAAWEEKCKIIEKENENLKKGNKKRRPRRPAAPSLKYLIPLYIALPLISITFFTAVNPLDMFVFWAVITGLLTGIITVCLLHSIFNGSIGPVGFSLVAALPLLVPIIIAYTIGGILAVILSVVIGIIAAIIILVKITSG